MCTVRLESDACTIKNLRHLRHLRHRVITIDAKVRNRMDEGEAAADPRTRLPRGGVLSRFREGEGSSRLGFSLTITTIPRGRGVK
jgi:hypothetical protein